MIGKVLKCEVSQLANNDSWIIKEFLLNWYCLMVITFNTRKKNPQNNHKICIFYYFFTPGQKACAKIMNDD